MLLAPVVAVDLLGGVVHDGPQDHNGLARRHPGLRCAEHDDALAAAGRTDFECDELLESLYAGHFAGYHDAGIVP